MKLAIYKNRENEITNVQIVPEKWFETIDVKVAEYNKNEHGNLVLIEDVSEKDDVMNAVAFLTQKREYDLDYHINRMKDIVYELRDIGTELENIEEYVKETMLSFKKDVENK